MSFTQTNKSLARTNMSLTQTNKSLKRTKKSLKESLKSLRKASKSLGKCSFNPCPGKPGGNVISYDNSLKPYKMQAQPIYSNEEQTNVPISLPELRYLHSCGKQRAGTLQRETDVSLAATDVSTGKHDISTC